MDKGKVTALSLLDLAAAFDTTVHKILLYHLKQWFSLSGLALSGSHLAYIPVCVNQHTSAPTVLKCDVP